MDTLKIAKTMLDAASTLGLEEVMYSLGLDSDHVETVDYVEATLPDGSTRTVEVPVSEEEGDRRLAERIREHEAEIQVLVDGAAALVERDLGITLGCSPLGDGVCDGSTVSGGSCDCDCHYADDLPPTSEGVKAWHEARRDES